MRSCDVTRWARIPVALPYGYEKRIEHDGNRERIRGLQQIVPA